MNRKGCPFARAGCKNCAEICSDCADGYCAGCSICSECTLLCKECGGAVLFKSRRP